MAITGCFRRQAAAAKYALGRQGLAGIYLVTVTKVKRAGVVAELAVVYESHILDLPAV